MTQSKYKKKVENKECPFLDINIVVRSGLSMYWCRLFFDKKRCIFTEENERAPVDAGECSYYLFPEDTPLYKSEKIMRGVY